MNQISINSNDALAQHFLKIRLLQNNQNANALAETHLNKAEVEALISILKEMKGKLKSDPIINLNAYTD